MSLKGKDTFSKWGSKRSYSSFGKATNNRFSPGTWTLRRLAIVRFLSAVGTSKAPRTRPRPLSFWGYYRKKESCRHVGNRTDAVCLLADKRIEWSVARQTGPERGEGRAMPKTKPPGGEGRGGPPSSLV